MKKRSLGIGLLLTGFALTVGAFLIPSNKTKIGQTEAIGNYSTDASTYYNGITATTGKQLAAQLHDLITSTHRYYTSYADNGGNLYQQKTDQYYENGSKVNGYLYEFYSGVKWPNAWAATAGSTSGGYNREHCWCQSNSVNTGGKQMWGENGGGSDMHHIRPVECRLNSTRNNHPYGEVSNRDSKKSYAKFGTNETYALGGYTDTTADVFEPLDSKKGDVARIILYTYLHYNSYTISDLFGSYGTTNGSGDNGYFSTSLLSLTKTTNQTTEAKALTMLLKWNSDDPVDEIEQRRNEQVAVYQGNRNPFIDNSSYADAIWGTTGITSISKTSAELTTGGTTTISAISSNSGTISWTTSNSSICSVSSATSSSGSSITLTAGSTTGTATITASVTISGTTYTKTCTVTVSTPKTLSSISVSEQKTSYEVGDSFVRPTVTANYSDSSHKDVSSSATFSGYDLSVAGNYTVTVSYTEGTTKTATYSITVNSSGGSGGGESGSFSGTYNYGNQGTGTGKTWSLTDCSDKSNYWLCPDTGDESVALISGIFTDLTITSNVVITINSGTYGSGSNPSSSTYAIYNSSACTSQVSATQTGTLPTSKTYTDAIYTVSLANASSFSNDLAIKITKPGKQIRLFSITVEFDYETQGGSSSLTLSSISLDTSNVQTAFSVGDTFNCTGLVVTAHYSDSSSSIVTPTSVSTPSTSSTGNKTVTVSYTEGGVTKTETYSITVTANPSISWTAPTINVYSGSTLSGTDVNAWAVTYNDGAGNQTVLTYSQLTVKLGGTTISIPHTWAAEDDGKTLTATYNSLTTTASSSVQITQSVNTINKEVPGTIQTSSLVFTKACGGSGTADDGKTWTVTSDAAESNYDSTKGIHYGTGSAAVEYIQLVSDSFTSGTITQVVVNASGASGVSGSVSVTVGGNEFGEVQSFDTTASNKTFTGSASAGRIVVRIYKASAAVKAIYCKSVAVSFSTSSSIVNIANSTDHIAAQRVAVKFAKAFNAAMDTTSGCTTNLSSAWSTCSSAYSTFLTEAAALGETEEAYAKNLIKYATAQYSDDSGEACIERMMKTYEVCVQKHGQTAFMNELVELGKAPISVTTLTLNNATNITIIVVASVIMIAAVGGYFYIRRLKQK